MVKSQFKIAYAEIAIQAFLVLATLTVFWQTSEFDFVNYDDDRYVTKNQYIRSGLTQDNILWAFTDAYEGNWHPLTWISHMLDVQLFGMSPGMHHLASVALHICNALLVFGVFRRMTGEIWKSDFVAALFALHPLHVESVAWVAERKDVLSAFFGLLSIWAYVAYARNPGIIRYIPVFIFFALGLMSKPTLVTLPCVLLLLDYWPLQRLHSVSFRVLEKVPLFLLAGVSCWITYTAQQYGRAVRSMEEFSLQARICNAFTSYMTYIGKTLWPTDLIFFYPHPGESLRFWYASLAALGLLAITVIAFKNTKRFPYQLTGWLWYLGTLVPVIGLIQVGHQAMADRYTYIPSIGLYILFAWGIPDLTTRWPRQVLYVASSVILPILMFMAWKQTGYWKNSFTLYEHALSVSPDNIMAKYNYAVAPFNLGNAYLKLGKHQEAIAEYKKVLRANPELPQLHLNMGISYIELGKYQEAVAELKEAIRLKPDYAEAHYNLGALYSLGKNGSSAITEMLIAIELFEKAENIAHTSKAKNLLRDLYAEYSH